MRGEAGEEEGEDADVGTAHGHQLQVRGVGETEERVGHSTRVDREDEGG